MTRKFKSMPIWRDSLQKTYIVFPDFIVLKYCSSAHFVNKTVLALVSEKSNLQLSSYGGPGEESIV